MAGWGISLLKIRDMADFEGSGTPRATMQNIAHALREHDERREETFYGSNDFIYMPLWTSEANEQPLGTGPDYVEWHYVHALGLGSCVEQRHYRSLRRGVRLGFV
jgi:hypothetical protein